MKCNKNFRDFIRRKKVAAGCIAIVVIITAGSLALIWQPSDIPELTEYTDPVIETTLTDDDTPLASKPKITTKTTKNTKTSKKTVKLKKAAKRTYTKKLPTQIKKSDNTKKKNSTTTVKTEKTIKTATTEKYTRKSKKKLVTKKVTTTVKTITTVAQKIEDVQGEEVTIAGDSNPSSSGNKNDSSKKKYTISNVATIAPKMDSRILNAFTKMGFTVTIDPTVCYGGYFSAKNRSITLRKADDTIYHELGHYLAFIAGNVDVSDDFKKIYNSEKSKFPGVHKMYAVSNSSEYFAECMREYINNPAPLKKKCPKSYATIEKAMDRITDKRVNGLIEIYAAVWK